MLKSEYGKKEHRNSDASDQSNKVADFFQRDETGLTLIDDQHIVLIETVNALYSHVKNKQGKTETFPVLAALRHYLQIHHATEKVVLEFCNPQYGALYDLRHQEAARQLLKVENLIRRDMDPKGMIDYLKHWWPQHMDGHREFFRPPGGSDRIH